MDSVVKYASCTLPLLMVSVAFTLYTVLEGNLHHTAGH